MNKGIFEKLLDNMLDLDKACELSIEKIEKILTEHTMPEKDKEEITKLFKNAVAKIKNDSVMSRALIQLLLDKGVDFTEIFDVLMKALNKSKGNRSN